MAPEAMQKTSRRPRSFFNSDFIKIDFFYGGEAGIRTLGTLLFTCSPNMRLRPLGHLSPVDNYDAKLDIASVSVS